MAKKKKMGWDFDAADDAAKDSIKATSHAKPKNKVGRPREMEQPTTKVLISVEARDKLKRLAAMKGDTMTVYLSDLIMKQKE